MSKTKTRLIIVITAIVTIISTFCYAETNQATDANVENVNPAARSAEGEPMPINDSIPVEDSNTETPVEGSENQNTVPTDDTIDPTAEETTQDMPNENDIHNGDLYLFDSNVTMDKLVDGNVFIVGNNVKITGQCSGNMFVFGNNITFDKAFIQASAFVFGNKVTYNAVSTTLYCTAAELTIDNQFGVYSDLFVACNKLNYDGIVGRNAFITADKANFGENGIIYGDLNYSTSKELEFNEGAVTGSINYTKPAEKEDHTIGSYIMELVQFLFFLTVLFLLIKLFTDSPVNREESTLNRPLKTFGIGVLSAIVIPIIAIILLCTIIGILPSVYLLGAYIYMLFFSTFIFTISLARYLCVGKKSRGIKEFGFSVLIYTIIWLLGLIPFVGGIIKFIVGSLGFGIMIYTPLMKKFASKQIKTKDESPVKDSQTSDNKKSEE